MDDAMTLKTLHSHRDCLPVTPSQSLQQQEAQRRAFESWLRELQLLVPAEQIEASGHD